MKLRIKQWQGLNIHEWLRKEKPNKTLQPSMDRSKSYIIDMKPHSLSEIMCVSCLWLCLVVEHSDIGGY